MVGDGCAAGCWVAVCLTFLMSGQQCASLDPNVIHPDYKMTDDGQILRALERGRFARGGKKNAKEERRLVLFYII